MLYMFRYGAELYIVRSMKPRDFIPSPSTSPLLSSSSWMTIGLLLDPIPLNPAMLELSALEALEAGLLNLNAPNPTTFNPAALDPATSNPAALDPATLVLDPATLILDPAMLEVAPEPSVIVSMMVPWPTVNKI